MIFGRWTWQPNDVPVDNFEEVTSSISNEIQECELDEDSSQVAVFIAGFITKKCLKKSQCEACLALLLNGDSSATEYVNALSREGLMIPSQYLSDHVCHCFATLDMIKKILITAASNNIRRAAESTLKLYCGSNRFMCDEHSEWVNISVFPITLQGFGRKKGISSHFDIV